MPLSEKAEEAAGFFGKMLEHEYTSKDIFCNNFFEDWRKVREGGKGWEGGGGGGGREGGGEEGGGRGGRKGWGREGGGEGGRGWGEGGRKGWGREGEGGREGVG